MKISIIQIVLGLMIIVAMALSIAWDPTGFYIRGYLRGSDSWKIFFNPNVREVFATILSFLVLLLGLAIMGVSIAILVLKIRSEYIRTRIEMNTRLQQLSIIQIVSGLLVTVSAYLIMIWGFPTSYNYSFPDNYGLHVFFMPGHQFIWAQYMSVLTFLISIPTICFGITQLRSARLSRAIGMSREE
jgi:hypothetical protein